MSNRIRLHRLVIGCAIAAIGCCSSGCAVSREKSESSAKVAEGATPNGVEAGPTKIQAVELASADNQGGQTTWRIHPQVSVLPPVHGEKQVVPPHIESRMQYAFDLAQRGATYSAYAEFQSVLSMCAAELDAVEGGNARRNAIQEGFVAMDEAKDFCLTPAQLAAGRVDVVRITASHRTPFHRQIKDEAWNIEQATKAYYEFAMQRIAEACRGAAAAPNALYGMGRTSALLDESGSHGTVHALLLYTVALQLDPTHALAANEMGVLLAQNGRFNEAEHALRQAALIDGSQESWANLAVVYQRLGRTRESQLALARSKNAGNVNEALSAEASTLKDATRLAEATDAEKLQRPAAEDIPEAGVKREPQSLATETIKQNILGFFRR